ncbi:hypothetical protein ABI59_18980 [Acidobacteria bacterium Mor1]|nr:hypothetical protein ABI59_18980 [Acidobacteria bacterium Mor1]
MNRNRVITLVVVAVLVLIFDWWYLFGGSDVDSAVERKFDDILTDYDEPEESEATADRPAAWTTWEEWLDRQKRSPLDGDLPGGLMGRARNAPSATGPVALPASEAAPAAKAAQPAAPQADVSVILWHPTDPSALIGGKVARPGDAVGSFFVGRIERDHVVMVHPQDDREWPIPLTPSKNPAAAAERNQDPEIDDPVEELP